MSLNAEKGGYCLGLVMRMDGAFRTNLADPPDQFRDGGSNAIASVTRESAGLFTVVFDGRFPLPERLTSWRIDMAQAVDAAVDYKVFLVEGSYSRANREFQIQVLKPTAADNTALVASDPDDLDRICFELKGSFSTVGTDAA